MIGKEDREREERRWGVKEGCRDGKIRDGRIKKMEKWKKRRIGLKVGKRKAVETVG